MKLLILLGSAILVGIAAIAAFVEFDGEHNLTPGIAAWLLCVIPAAGTLTGIVWMERRGWASSHGSRVHCSDRANVLRGDRWNDARGGNPGTECGHSEIRFLGSWILSVDLVR